MKPITTRVKESRSRTLYPANQEVTMNADGSGGPIDACGCGSPNKFKAHKMYGKSGGEVMADTKKEHLALKKEGFGHSPTKLKDACYKKVAARYSGGNSAYRSGAMAKCRKVGVANWGNSKK